MIIRAAPIAPAPIAIAAAPTPIVGPTGSAPPVLARAPLDAGWAGVAGECGAGVVARVDGWLVVGVGAGWVCGWVCGGGVAVCGGGFTGELGDAAWAGVIDTI